MEHIKKFDEFHNIEENVVDVNEGCLALNHDETPSNVHTEPLCEMANLSQRRTGINTRIYVSSKEGQHEPRIKVYNSSNDESFSMSIEDSPKVLIGNPNIVSTKIFKQIIKWVQINKNILFHLLLQKIQSIVLMVNGT